MPSVKSAGWGTGIIEAFFGKPWEGCAREDTLSLLASRGLQFYIHAPKSEALLRRRWREPLDEGTFSRLLRIRALPPPAASLRCRADAIRP
jgi:hypothetical protein